MATSWDDEPLPSDPERNKRSYRRHLPIPLTLLQYVIYPSLLVPWLLYYAVYTLRQGDLHELRSVLRQRLGWYDRASLPDGKPIWIHAVSVGEVMCIPPILEVLRDRHPDMDVIVTTSTLTGQRVARQNIDRATISYFPLDLPSSVRRAFKAFDPELILLVEQEIWPTFMQQASRQNVPVAVVNGRMTERSAARFTKLPERYRRQMFGALSGVIAQTDAYAERFRSLGIPEDRVYTSGNVKYDAIVSNAPDADQIAGLETRYGLSSSSQVLVGGSIHPPEEEPLLDAFERLRDQAEDMRLILAPRHLKNTERMKQAAEKRNLSVALHSEGPENPDGTEQKTDVIVVDTMGVLATVYGLGDLAFVGGSLIEHGGQNMLEPAVLGTPIVTGPHTSNFREEVALLTEAGGLEEVQNEQAFVSIVQDLFNDPDRRSSMGKNAKEAIRAHSGAAQRTIDLLEQLNLLTR